MNKCCARLITVLGFLLVIENANAQATSLEKELNRSVLTGCLPNAMGVFPFLPQASEAVEKAGFRLGTEVPFEEARRLALEPNFALVSPTAAMKNIVLLPSPSYHACTVGVFDAPAKDLRAALIAELTAEGAPWKSVGENHQGNILAQTYEWTIDDTHVFDINITGPENSPTPAGLQLMVRVAQVKK